MSENVPSTAETTSASVPGAAAPASRPDVGPGHEPLNTRPVYVEKYEAETHDDGATWIYVFTGWEDDIGFHGRRQVGILPIKFPADLRECARDFAWLLNKVRADRIEAGHYKPVT
jgi:hypothetical protein